MIDIPLGPWRAAIRFMDELSVVHDVAAISRIDVNLYGSLSLKGAGHSTDIAVVMGLRQLKGTNNIAWKNMKLNISHMPKPYWKFLTEFH